MCENSGWAPPEGTLNSESATSCAKIELAMQSTRSTKPRRKIILGTIKRFKELRGNLEKRRWLQNSWPTTFDSWTAGYNTWENKVKKLIEKFENHQHKESFLQDLRQTEKINKFSRESQELIANMNNTEIFELCENSSKQQCPECNAHWGMGIIYYSCGRNMKSTRGPTEFDQNNRDVTSIPGHVIQKNSSHGAKHGPSERQKMHCQAKLMLEKARKGKHGGHPTILSRWYACDEYRKSLSAPLQELKEFRLRIIGFLRQILEEELSFHSIFAQAKRECKRLHDEHLARTQQEYRDIPRSQQIRQRRGQQFEGSRSIRLRRWPENR